MAIELARRAAYSRGAFWTKQEEKSLMAYLKKYGFDSAGLKKLFPERSLPAIRSKVRKLRIKNDLFGNVYREDKQNFTRKIAEAVRPKVVFDAYAGAGHQTFEWIKVANVVYASESMPGKIVQFRKRAAKSGFIESKIVGNWYSFKSGQKRVYYYCGDAVEAAALIKNRKVKIDLIDLDTCGSTIPTIPIYLILLKPKNLVITHGEFHSLRFQRDDVLRRLFFHKGISKPSLPLTVDQMSKHLDKSVKLAALRSHNETVDSFWMEIVSETWLGSKFHGMLRRHYVVSRPKATADCINLLSKK